MTTWRGAAAVGAAVAMAFALGACGGLPEGEPVADPQTKPDHGTGAYGGGLDLGELFDDDDDADASGDAAGGDAAPAEARQDGGGRLGVNALLWRASLETLSFMPLRDADRQDGVISTDWHAQPADAEARFRLDVHVRSQALRADGIKVQVFRQVRSADGSGWQQAEVSPDTARGLEDAIIAQARELRLRQRQDGGADG